MFIVDDADNEAVGVFATLAAARHAADVYSKTQSFCNVKQFVLNAPCTWQDAILYSNHSEPLQDVS